MAMKQVGGVINLLWPVLGESTPVVIMAVAAKTVLCYSLSLDDPEVAAASLLSRAKLVQQMCVEAGANLRIVTQHRDSHCVMLSFAVESTSHL
jgi:hypothetical protein